MVSFEGLFVASNPAIYKSRVAASPTGAAMTSSQRNDLLEVMDDRHGTTSTIIASQLPTSEWHHSLGDATRTDAILDRLMHNAHRIPLKGESIRKRHSNEEMSNSVIKNDVDPT